MDKDEIFVVVEFLVSCTALRFEIRGIPDSMRLLRCGIFQVEPCHAPAEQMDTQRVTVLYFPIRRSKC